MKKLNMGDIIAIAALIGLPCAGIWAPWPFSTVSWITLVILVVGVLGFCALMAYHMVNIVTAIVEMSTYGKRDGEEQ